ncbi:MAG: DUF512 domain-containing protein [Clostridia bacterium]|nr:DUF512 domain-containing protein [Clostridia bacterium]
MATEITHVQPGSIAERLSLVPGDRLKSIAGEPVIDQIDYQALTARARFTMEVIAPDGTEREVLVRKKDWEPLGLTLDQTIVSAPRPCANRCIFCFIDQMPPGMRRTLYVKDDDWRLSLMMGNFITMTNITEKEFDRILRRRVSPLYISVHTTDPALRCRMMGNPHAGNVMERLQRLKDAGLRFHCQIVLCPGWNDGDALRRTLQDLASLYPAACSVALVPVGLTKYREGLPVIRPYDRESAARLVDEAHAMQEAYFRQLSTRFVFPSDEFYCLSGRPLPEDEAYEDYPQIENGVGMLRMFETDLAFAAMDEPVAQTPERQLVIGCGTSIAGIMQGWCDRYAPRGTHVRVKPIINHFFGESVTVTGLLTGGDLLAQLKDEVCDAFLICRNTIRNEGDLFLDDMPVEELRRALPAPLRIVENTGEAFWHAISGWEEHHG